MKEKGKALAWSGLYLAISFAMMFVLAFILGFASMVAGLHTGIIQMENVQQSESLINSLVEYVQQGTPLMILNLADELVMFVGFGLWYYFREKKYNYRPNYKKAFGMKNVLSMAGIAFFGQYALNLFMLFVYCVMPGIFSEYEELIKNLDIDAGNPVVMIFCVVLFGPLVEEFLFRGMIFGKLRRVFTFWPCAIISGAFFGLYHMNLVQGIYAGVFGIILAYVFEKTETIWGCYLLHAFFNMSSYVIQGYEEALRNSGFEMPGLGSVVISMVSLVIVVLLLKNFGKSRKKTDVNVNNNAA